MEFRVNVSRINAKFADHIVALNELSSAYTSGKPIRIPIVS